MSVKTLREDLCRHETDPDLPPDVLGAIGALVALVDEHRPLGADGKHGDLHTLTCGCAR